MSKVFIEQEDGSLKPVYVPERLAKRIAIYKYIREQEPELSLGEVKFIVDSENLGYFAKSNPY